MWRIDANNLIEEIVLPILRFRYLPNISLFCNDLVPKRIDFLFVEAAIENRKNFVMHYIGVVLEL